MALTEFQTKLAELVAKSAGATDWGPLFLELLDALGLTINELSLDKAPATHAHPGGTSEVMGIGPDTARPAVVDGFVFSQTTDDEVEVLDASGNVVFTLVKPDALAGHISNLLITRPTTTDLTLAPFSVEINGKMCRLPSAATITPTGTAGAWIYIMAGASAVGNVLAAGNLSWTETVPTRDPAKGNAFYSADGTKRCIAAWKLASTGQPLAATLANGIYNFREVEAVYGNASPPDSTIIDVDLDMPFAESLKAYFNTYIHALSLTTYLSVLNGDASTTADSWRHRALRAAASTPDYVAVSRRTNAGGEVQMTVSGDCDGLYVAVHEIEMPPQIGR